MTYYCYFCEICMGECQDDIYMYVQKYFEAILANIGGWSLVEIVLFIFEFDVYMCAK